MPFVFHMCWTSNRVDKLKYFKDIGLWYIPDAAGDRDVHGATNKNSNLFPAYCSDPKHMVAWGTDAVRAKSRDGKAPISLVDRCCLKNKYFKFQG